jgi:non-ribosomal peptide synthase protein (TIGR01720 family)
VDFAGENSESSTAVHVTSLTAEDTSALLQDAPRTHRALPSEVLLTALAETLSQWCGSRGCRLDLEGHGRESFSHDIDLSRTVGWFTALYPVRLDTGAAATPVEALKMVKEQVRAVPRGGLGYGVLKYMDATSATAKRLADLPAAEVSFNYVGAQDAAESGGEIRPATESVGRLSSEGAQRPYLLMISATVQGERLSIQWSYSRNVHRAETIEKLAASFAERLQALLRPASATEAALFTPSDFPHAQLSQLDLDEFIASIGAEAGAQSE